MRIKCGGDCEQNVWYKNTQLINHVIEFLLEYIGTASGCLYCRNSEVVTSTGQTRNAKTVNKTQASKHPGCSCTANCCGAGWLLTLLVLGKEEGTKYITFFVLKLLKCDVLFLAYMMSA